MKWLARVCVFGIAALVQTCALAASTSTLPESRILLFDDYALTNNLPTPTWVHDGPAPVGASAVRNLLAGTNHFHRTGWKFLFCRNGTARGLGLEVAPDVATNLAANLQNSLEGLIESPVLQEGVGKVYFEAINNSLTNQIVVEWATNMVATTNPGEIYPMNPPSTNGLEYAWNTLDTLTLNAVSTSEITRYQRSLNFHSLAKLRIRRVGAVYGDKGLDAAFTVIDNIRVSPPPADVVVYNTEAFHQSTNQVIRCYVSNLDLNAAATSRTVTAYYRWHYPGPDSNVLHNTTMGLADGGDGLGNGEKYQLLLPSPAVAGKLEYYVVCAFDGASYQSPDYTGLGYAYASESRSPFTTSTLTNTFAGAGYYALAVAGGTGSGSTYTNGQVVAVAANAPAIGKVFDRWTGATQYVANVTSSSTTVTMPDSDVSITASYKDIFYTLTVGGGTGSGSFTYGQQVPIVADAPLAGKVFDRWTGATQSVSSVTSATAVVTMPASNITVTATYVDVYALTVNSGSGSGSYRSGQQVTITADAPPFGKAFDRWTGSTAYVGSVTSATTVVTMPAGAITLTATYVNVYTLTVNSGSGGGSYKSGQQVTITADAPPVGKTFDRWIGDTQYVASVSSATTMVTMPSDAVSVTATYIDVYTLTVNSGSGSGSYRSGQQVAITAYAPGLAKMFDQWTGATQYLSSVTSMTTVVTMPATNIAVTASYKDVYYTLTVTGGSGSGSYTNQQKVTILAPVLPEKTFVGWIGATQYVASVTSATTVVTMPASDIFVSAIYSGLTSTLPESRILLFDDYALTNNPPTPTWVHDGPAPTGSSAVRNLLAGTNHFHRTGWSLFACRTGTARGLGLEVAPDVATNLAANLQNTLGAAIESPVFQEGIGTVYFEAINNSTNTQITVELATNMVWASDPLVFSPMNPPSTNGWIFNWVPVEDLTLSAATTNEFVRYARMVNYRQPVKLRIRRSGSIYPDKALDAAFTVIDNIRVSKPPADVVVRKTECPFESGYPAVNENFSIRCYVDNVDTNAPADSRIVDVYFRWRYLDQASNAWAKTTMGLVDAGDGKGNNERFKIGLPVQTQLGDLEYYFVCAFGGYRYQSPDYTGLGYVYANEGRPPYTLRGGADGEREFYTRLRPFKSPYGALYVMTDQIAEPVEMALVGDDEWRGMVPIRTAGVTNLTWYFKGTNAYVQGSDTFSTNVSCWGEQSQVGVGRVPYGGVCVLTNDSVRMQETVSGGGYVQMVFNTRTMDFMTCRAEYQNFNAWPASDVSFSDSSGQDPKHRYLNTFEGWTTNADQTFKEYFVGYPALTNVYVRDPFLTFQSWVAGSAAYVSERNEADYDNKPTGVVGFRNVSMRLKGGDSALGLGYVYNQVASRPDGLKQVTFKCRLGQAINNYDVAYNQTEFTKSNYLVRANVAIISPMSPEQPSLSLVGYYQNPGNFYEYRVTQAPDTTIGRDKRMYHQIYKWVNGTASLLATATRDGDERLDSGLAITPELRIFSTSASSTRIRCKFGNADNVVVATDSSSPLSSGTYGFLTADCRGGFSSVYTQPTTTDAALSGSATLVLDSSNTVNFDAQKVNWYAPAGRFEVTRAVSPFGVYSVIPSQKVGIYLQDTDYASTTEPSAPGTTAWTKFQEVTVPDFGYTSVVVPVNNWKSQFVLLQLMGGNADVAVDELQVSSWHGKQSGNSGTGNWLATEAWVVSNSVPQMNVVQLDHSRANPEIDQAIRSVMLDTGMGMMEFDYRVLRAPAVLAVQYANKRDANTWLSVRSFTNSTATGWTHVSAYLGNTNAGYLRVLNLREGAYTNALVEINDAIVWDEPAVNDTSWKVYNAKITDTDLMRVSLDETKACFLNNSQTLETDPIQDQSEPYVQCPLLPDGFGDIKFNARAYTNNQPATVYLFASTNGWDATDSQWFEVTRFENISNMLYQTFSYHIDGLVGQKFDAVRLMTKTSGGAKRACLEEVAVTEPVFPGFDIVNVRALCEENDGSYSTTRFQPLVSDDVGVEAQIANKQLAPSNIQMYVTYYIGTNVWGVDNWPSGQTVTRPMYPTAENPLVYRTSPNNDIPVQEKDQVVQYHVWATYLGGIPLVKEQEPGTSWENPSWYYPVDLNQTYAAQGWAPYYIVYAVPLGAVWINEINSTDYVISNGVRVTGIGDNPYLEIAVPAGVDLAGWKVELVSSDQYSVHTILLPSGLPVQEDSTNGYAFFVIGEHPAFRDPSVPPLTKLDYGYPGFSDVIPRIQPGGLRLRRPWGMYEHTPAYDWNAAYGSAFAGTNWVANAPDHRFVYVGRENNGGSLSVTNGVGATIDDWCFPRTWTPGWANEGQTVQSAAAILPGVSNVVVTSTMNSDKATQNGKRTAYYSLKLRRGDTTNINYVADSWYRIYSVKMNDVEQLSLGSVTNTFNLPLIDIQTNISVNVTVALRGDVAADVIQNPTLLNWLLGFGDAPLVPSWYNGRELSLTELYWLNANPTVTNRLDFMVTKFSTDSVSNIHATVKLALNGSNVTNLQGNSVMKVEVKQGLLDPAWSLLAQYALTRTSFDSNNLSRITVTNQFNYVLKGWDPKAIYSRGMIEMEDPRIIVQELHTEP